MPTPVRETVLAWVAARLATIAGYTVLRNDPDDAAAALPCLVLMDGDEEAVEPGENDEQAWSLLVLVSIVATAATAEALGPALSDGIAKVYNALMDQSAWTSPVRRVRPEARERLDVSALFEKAELVLAAVTTFRVEYPTLIDDAFTASP